MKNKEKLPIDVYVSLGLPIPFENVHMMDTYSPTGYADGQARRRAKREKERNSKKK